MFLGWFPFCMCVCAYLLSITAAGVAATALRLINKNTEIKNTKHTHTKNADSGSGNRPGKREREHSPKLSKLMDSVMELLFLFPSRGANSCCPPRYREGGNNLPSQHDKEN